MYEYNSCKSVTAPVICTFPYENGTQISLTHNGMQSQTQPHKTQPIRQLKTDYFLRQLVYEYFEMRKPCLRRFHPRLKDYFIPNVS